MKRTQKFNETNSQLAIEDLKKKKNTTNQTGKESLPKPKA